MTWWLYLALFGCVGTGIIMGALAMAYWIGRGMFRNL